MAHFQLIDCFAPLPEREDVDLMHLQMEGTRPIQCYSGADVVGHETKYCIVRLPYRAEEHQSLVGLQFGLRRNR